jgi:hypothetical protein
MKYTIGWLVDCLQFNRKTKLSIGFCEKTKRIVFIRQNVSKSMMGQLTVLAITDVYADDEGCEDGKFCMDLDCEHNKANLDAIREHARMRFESLEVMREFMKRLYIPEMLQMARFDGNVIFYEKPPFNWVRSI